MPAIIIDPQDEEQQKTTGTRVALRIGAIILGLFLGFSSYVGAYVGLVLIGDPPGDDNFALGRFSISIWLWALLGAFMPFDGIKGGFTYIFDFIRGSSESKGAISYGRLIAALVILLVILYLYWHVLGAVGYVINSAFGE